MDNFGGIAYLYRNEIKAFVQRFRWLVGCVALDVIWHFVPGKIAGVDIWMLKNLVLYLPWLMYAISVKSPILSNKVMKYLSGISLELYLAQMVIFSVIEKANCLYLFGNWQENCLKLKAFYEAHGHTDLPEEYRELREWLLTQRGIFKRGAYSKQKMDFLRENGLIEVFKELIRSESVKLNMTLPKAQYDALMRVVTQKGCKSIEEYLAQLSGA